MMLSLGAIAIESHEAGNAWPLLAFAQGAQIIGDPLRQHRHHAIGEINRISSDARLVVERRTRAHIGGHIGNGDDHIHTTFILGIVVRFGPHRIVVVARIGRIDGEKRDMAQIGPIRR